MTSAFTTPVVTVTIEDNGNGTATLTTYITDVLPNDMRVNDDGSMDLNVRLRVLNPFTPNTTGVGSITVLPDLSMAVLDGVLGRGAPGPLTRFTEAGVVHPVDYNSAMPTPAMKWVEIEPPNHSSGIGPLLQLHLWQKEGQPGPPGTPVQFTQLVDVHPPGEGEGGLVNGLTPVYRAAGTAGAGYYLEPTRLVDAVACTAFTAASGNTPEQTLGTVTLPARNYARLAYCTAQCQINPAADTSNGITHIDLIARLGHPVNGVIVGYGMGLDTNAPFIANLHPTPAAFGSGALIAAGQAATIYLIAIQTNATLSDWSTVMSHASFTALGLGRL